MASYNPVIAVLRGIEVLRLVNQMKQATIRELHQETGFDKATIFRMLHTLQHAGYVYQDKKTKAYLPTGRVFELSSGYNLLDRAAELAGPLLKRFRIDHGWPSDLALPDRDAMMLVGTSRDAGPLTANRPIGYRANMILTSVGRAWLAHCAPEVRRSTYEILKSAPNAPELPGCEQFEDELQMVRDLGYAVMTDQYSQEEYDNVFWAIAVPVAADGRLFGSLNVMMLRKAVSFEMAQSRLLPPLLTTAHQIAEAFVSSDFCPFFAMET